jgi:hypothetical protein
MSGRLLAAMESALLSARPADQPTVSNVPQLKEEEELQLAMALSMSEAQSKVRATHVFGQ